MLIWIIARGAGIAAFAALSVATGLGAATSARDRLSPGNRLIWQYVHRATALSGVCLILLHITLLLADPFAHVGALGALVPLASGYRPWQVSLGVIAAYCLAAVTLTSLWRVRLAARVATARAWRSVHVLAYLAWVSAAWHFLFTGTDSGRWWAQAVLCAGAVVVVVGVAVRVTAAITRRPRVLPGARVALFSAPTEALRRMAGVR
jgi:sulfoxide reductase heme-binding subunit YedZ